MAPSTKERRRAIRFPPFCPVMRKTTNEELHRPTPEAYARMPKMPVTVVLDNVRSLNNVGSFFRTCDAFAVERLVLCGITGTPPSRELHKTALGAEHTVAWCHYDATADATMKVGRCYVTRMALFQQLLPNNSGIALQTKHSINQMFLQIYRSQGGSVWANGAKIADLLQLEFGIDVYNDNSTNPLTDTPYTFSGVYTIDNPIQNVEEDNLSIITADPYPFNLVAISMKYTLTEVY